MPQVIEAIASLVYFANIGFIRPFSPEMGPFPPENILPNIFIIIA
jgi:hypothetical protein